jgi:hypothetical protein
MKIDIPTLRHLIREEMGETPAADSAKIKITAGLQELFPLRSKEEIEQILQQLISQASANQGEDE